MQLINDGILWMLIELYKITGNLGVSILLFTLIVRSLLLPLSLPVINSQKKMKKLQPEVDALKKKHGEDKKAFQMAQLELYKKYNINPLAGCLPQIAQIALLILLYRVLVRFIGQSDIGGVTINPNFLWLDLRHPDPRFIIPVLAGVTQLILSIMILPGGEVPDIVPNTSKDKNVKKANEQEEDAAAMAATMQKQMLFMMPVMTGLFAMNFPSGLGLYWVATTVFSVGQQWLLSGPGGLVKYLDRIFRRQGGGVAKKA